MRGPFAAPTSGRPELLRARLLERLQARWTTPVVAVIAGAGFGKTTLLAQARAENLLDARGEDLWLSLTPDDGGAGTLSSHLARALGLAPSPGRDINADELADAITARAPLHLCLLLDDAHHLERSTTGASLLGELIEALPSNGHVVLAGRPPGPVGLARLRAQGRVTVIAESEMAFDDAEGDAFATLRLADRAVVARAAGWPALAELHAAADREAALDFLWQELLSAMAPLRQRDLAVLSAVGRADDELLSAACGRELSVRDVVRNLPLSSITDDGWASVHDLWQPALVSILTVTERSDAQERAAVVARGREHLTDAFRLFADASRWDQAEAIVRHACANSHPLVPIEVLAQWHDRLLTRHTPSAEVTLLQGVIVKQTAPDDAVLCLRRAAEVYREAGSRDDEASCLFHLGHLFWWGDRTDELMALVDRVMELAVDGSWLATSMIELGAVLLGGPADADPMRVSVSVEGQSLPLHPEVVPLRCWLLARNHLFAGDARQALVTAEASVATATPTMRAVSDFLVLQCLWASGVAGARQRVLDTLDATLEAVRREGWLHFTVADLGQAAMWVALCGRSADARRYLAEARSIPQLTSAWSDAVLGIADAVLCASEGQDDEAARLVAAEMARRPIEDPSADLAHRPWLAISYVLAPSAREHWDGDDLGAGHLLARQCARALVAFREERSLDAARGLVINGEADIARMQSFLPPPWLAELAALLEAADRSADAAALLGASSNEARPRLAKMARTAAKPVAAAAAVLLRTVARAPAQSVEIDVLGPLRIRFDGEVGWPTELNRRPVRDLLLLLVEHDQITRERIAALLWPDLEESAGRANLRTNLSYLNKALEPKRAEGETPFFVVERGEQLALARGPHLVIDAVRFDDAIKRAARAEAQGALTAAIDARLEAVELYRGEYATDTGTPEWVLPSREQTKVRFVAACVRAGALLVARGQSERAVELATRAVAVEPWSEPARTLLAEAYLALGDTSAARRAVAQCDAMLDDMGTAESPPLAMLRRRLSGAAA